MLIPPQSKAQGHEPTWAWTPALRGWGHLSCLRLPLSLIGNDLPGSLSKINMNALNFNFKNLELFILSVFGSSKGPIWECLPQEGPLGKLLSCPGGRGGGGQGQREEGEEPRTRYPGGTLAASAFTLPFQKPDWDPRAS